ncbi:LysR family transcriptional regulator [Streptomyces marokkonensis]|uniref:LysR family transcriptional regulator n=1 Tax=Streptomyces marokkonensis TaxID=324855 RepID=UPI001FCB6DBC|nr:LysR family transcriptional regulator [Streptomyces marokkonensis]
MQSALSTSIRNPERELGADLFGRTGRRVVLTEAGWELLPQARALPAGERSAREAVAAADGLTEALRAGELDLAYLAPDARGTAGRAVGARAWHEELVLITAPGHPLAGAGKARISDPAEEPFVDFRAGTGLETAARRLTAHCGLTRRTTCDVTQAGPLVDPVRAGTGVAFVPRPIGERAGLPCATVRQPDPGRTVVPAGRGSRPRHPAAGALLDHLVGRGRLRDAGPAAAGPRDDRRPPAG